MTNRVSPDPILLDVNDFCRVVGVGRTKAYQLFNSGRVRTVKIGKLTKVPVDAIHEFVASLRAEGSDAA